MTGTNKRLAEASGPELKRQLVTLQTLLTESAKQYPDKIALICPHQPADYLGQKSVSENSGDSAPYLRWTYTQLFDAAATFAASLHSHGIRKGMRIAAFLRNGAQWAIGIWAAALLGCPFVTINASFANKPDDAQHMLATAEASVIFVEDDLMANDIEAAAGSEFMDKMIVKLVAHRTGDEDALAKGWTSLETLLKPDQDQHSMPPDDETRTSDDDLALVIFTSGTTSRPKGVRQTNRSLVSGFLTGAQGLEMDSSHRSCECLPTFHIFGIVFVGHYWACGGAVCFPSATFDPAATLKAIEDERLTHLPGPPSLLHALVTHPTCATTNLESLQLIVMAAAVVLPEAIKAVGKALRCDRIACPFGMSEGSPLTYPPYEDLPIQYSEEGITIGVCLPNTRARICKPNSREVVCRGELGELHVGGPTITPGYLGRESDEFYVERGTQWLMTGDQAKMGDEGEMYILGRYKDVIIRAGENISPSSIEAVLDSMPGITSQVVGVADEVAGEVPAAVLKVDDGTEVDEAAMHELLDKKLGNVFVPAHILTVDDLGMDDFPRTESGKYQKFELKQPVADFVEGTQTSNSDGVAADHTDDLRRVWAKLLGLSESKLSSTTSIEDLADSITVMRAASKIKRELGQDIRAHEILDNPTIEAQAKLLQSRQKPDDASKRQPVQARSGPPGTSEVAHILDSAEKMADLQTAFAKAAEPLGLAWEEDVEDVLPVWDWGLIMLQGPRLQSWNHRHAFATTRATPEQLKFALERALSHQAMLRTLAVSPTNAAPSHVIIRSSPRWYKLCIREVEAVETTDDLKNLALNDPQLDHACAPGPLFRALIAPIRDTGTSGVVYQAHHSCFDGLSIPNLVEDLTIYLNSDSKDAAISPKTSYKGFADNLYLHRNSTQAQMSCDFHVKRLQGLSKLKRSLWPVQQVSGWFKGNFADVADDFPDRKALDGEKSIGVDGVKREVSLPGIQELRSQHDISAPSVLKTSLALLNAHYTKTKNAVFTNYEAGRDWAFQEPWIAELLPNAMDVNGPTLEAVLNNISVDDSETCLDMMKRIHEEQKLLTKHAHAPLLDIQQRLGEDGTDMIDIMRRQIFNWLPGLKSDMQEPEDSPLKRIQMQSRSDVGLLWNCGMIRDTFQVTASYDDAQLRAAEVEEAVAKWFEISIWMTDAANWGRPVGQCVDA